MPRANLAVNYLMVRYSWRMPMGGVRREKCLATARIRNRLQCGLCRRNELTVSLTNYYVHFYNQLMHPEVFVTVPKPDVSRRGGSPSRIGRTTLDVLFGAGWELAGRRAVDFPGLQDA
jgi:hypothetical protein